MISNDRFYTVATCVSGSQSGLNVRHWLVQSHTGNGMTDQEVASQMHLQMKPLYAAWMPSVAVYRYTTVQVYSPVLGNTFAFADVDAPGTLGLEVSPRQVSGLVSLRSDLGGKRNRGRAYVPFVSQANVVNGDQINAAARTALVNIGNFYNTSHALTGAAGTLVVVPIIEHRPLGSGFVRITHIVVRDGLATQRRRGFFGRKNPEAL